MRDFLRAIARRFSFLVAVSFLAGMAVILTICFLGSVFNLPFAGWPIHVLHMGAALVLLAVLGLFGLFAAAAWRQSGRHSPWY